MVEESRERVRELVHHRVKLGHGLPVEDDDRGRDRALRRHDRPRAAGEPGQPGAVLDEDQPREAGIVDIGARGVDRGGLSLARAAPRSGAHSDLVGAVEGRRERHLAVGSVVEVADGVVSRIALEDRLDPAHGERRRAVREAHADDGDAHLPERARRRGGGRGQPALAAQRLDAAANDEQVVIETVPRDGNRGVCAQDGLPCRTNDEGAGGARDDLVGVARPRTAAEVVAVPDPVPAGDRDSRLDLGAGDRVQDPACAPREQQMCDHARVARQQASEELPARPRDARRAPDDRRSRPTARRGDGCREILQLVREPGRTVRRCPRLQCRPIRRTGGPERPVGQRNIDPRLAGPRPPMG